MTEQLQGNNGDKGQAPECNLPATLPTMDVMETGYGGITREFVIPRMKIVQPTAKAGTPGTFSLNLTGEEFTELPLIIVKAEQTRVLWPPQDDKNRASSDQPLCRSYNCITPDPAIESPISPACARWEKKGTKSILVPVCPKAQWITVASSNKRKKPDCGEQLNFLALTVPEGLPFWIVIGGASMKSAMSYLSAIALRRKKLVGFKTVMKLDLRTEPHRHYALARMIPTPLAPEEFALYAEVIDGIKDATVERTMADEEPEADPFAPGADNDNGAPPEDIPDWMK